MPREPTSVSDRCPKSHGKERQPFVPGAANDPREPILADAAYCTNDCYLDFLCIISELSADVLVTP